MNELIIKAKNLCKYYGDGEGRLTVINNLDLDVPSNKTIAITGVSGSGKSTLLHIIGGLDFPSYGEVIINGLPISSASEKQINLWRQFNFGFIYQFHFLIAELSALENVALPLLIRGDQNHEAKELAKEILIKVGLGERLIHRPNELSGGERQRVAVARALVGKPQCIFADEPTGSLDSENALRVWHLIKLLCKECQTSLILVTHDRRLAEECDINYRLFEGSLQSN